MNRLIAIVVALLLSVPALVYAQDSGAEASAPPAAAEAAGGDAAFAGFDAAFGAYVVGPMASVLFWDVMFWDNDKPDGNAFPLVVLWLVLGAIFFTLRMSFINLRGFLHAIEVTRGSYDNPDDPGEISHFQALASALSATVGLGNIAGVAIAVGVGGPGAVLWMIFAGFLGMSSKFVECTLGQMYRTVDDQGQVMGGPMRYLEIGLSDLGRARLGKVLAVIFALMCIGGSLGGGNMFQANQSFAAVSEVIPLFEGRGWLYGLLLALAVGAVILGGIKRIGMAAGVIVPVMCGIYVLAALWILLANASQVPAAVAIIVGEAFKPIAVGGGIVGVIVQGFKRAAFSNEAGIGSASIAHSAAATDEPVREGIVALLEPFIDTLIVCTMTGLVVVITGAYKMETGDGVLMTSAAFESVLPWFPLVLSFAVVSFAFSTMISWSYYGERCATYLFGPAASVPYKIIFLACVFLGSVFKLGNVLDFSDLMVLGMAFPNILGAVMLSSKVRAALDDYWGRLTSGAMPRVK
ncbi:MAG: alanine glycine permease [Deltaproteobacteria bacterium]|nr:alanine glycine permease [Deltaproteobacteria bacterium]